jgi:hypothetical protein
MTFEAGRCPHGRVGLHILISSVLAPRLRTAESLPAVFLITAAIFFVGIAFFITLFATAKEIVHREVAKVTLK